MKKFLLAGAAAAAMTGTAFAADLPARSGPVAAPFVPPVFTWTGFYAGLNAGYGFSRNNASTIGNANFTALGPTNVPGSLRVGGDGFVGGGQLGYNWQFGQTVFGVETDLQYAWTGRATAFGGAPLGLITSAGRDDGYLGTVRARLGFAADRFLVYATGGLAYGSFDTSVAVVGTGATAGALWGGSSDSVRTGWTAGGGVEYAITNNWTVKLEGLYYDLGRKNVTAVALNPGATATGAVYQARVPNNGTIIRAGVNYKF